MTADIFNYLLNLYLIAFCLAAISYYIFTKKTGKNLLEKSSNKRTIVLQIVLGTIVFLFPIAITYLTVDVLGVQRESDFAIYTAIVGKLLAFVTVYIVAGKR